MDTASPGGERFLLRIDSKGTSCTVVIQPGPLDPAQMEHAIRAALRNQRIDPGRIDNGMIENLLERAASTPDEAVTGLVAQGVSPEHGENAVFELRRDIRDRIETIKERKNRLRATPNPEAPDDDEASDEAVDFRNQSAFVIVHQGDVIGTVTPETDGTDGVDVRGVVISAKKGRSLPITINDSLRLVGEDLVAQISGVLRVQLDKIVIEPVLAIKGDVDFETGNIDFPGGVDVSGGVKDHFVIRAGGEVTVHKLVEAAEIHGRSGVVLSQGMAGREMGRLVVGGDLRAGYLDGVEGEIRGCLRVAREIKECRLRVQRRVDAPESTVYGGRLEARQRVDLGVIGGPGGVFTEVMVGCLTEIETLAGKLARLRQSVDETRQLEEAELRALQIQIDSLTQTQADRLSELQSSRANRATLAARVVEAATRLLDAAGNWSETVLTIRRAAYKGARIRLRNTTLSIREMVQGPIHLSLDHGGVPRCYLRGSAEPTPIGEIAVIEETGEITDPIRLLRSVLSESA